MRTSQQLRQDRHELAAGEDAIEAGVAGGLNVSVSTWETKPTTVPPVDRFHAAAAGIAPGRLRSTIRRSPAWPGERGRVADQRAGMFRACGGAGDLGGEDQVADEDEDWVGGGVGHRSN